MDSDSQLSFPDTEHAWPVGKKMALFTCIVAALLNFFDMADRFMIAVLLPFLQQEWGLTDTQLGGLVSISSFSVAVLVVPVSILVDLWSRKKMMAIMGIVWSVATGMGAFCVNFFQLMVTRFTVGASQAAYLPAAQSLLGDVFPKHWRTRAMGTMILGAALGSPFGLVAASLIATHWGWRHAFGLLAIPGLIVAFLAFFLNDYDPDKAKRIANRQKAPSLLKELPRLLTNPTLLGVYLGNTLCLFFSGASGAWMPTYFVRVAGFSPAKAGVVTALSAAGLLLMIASTFIVDSMRKRDSAATAKGLMVCAGACAMFGIAGFTVMEPGSIIQIITITVAGGMITCVTPMCTTTILDVSPRSIKATAISLMVLTQNILGMSLGPLISGRLSDAFGLGPALAMMGVFPLLGVGAFFLSVRYYQRDLEKAEISNAAAS